MSERLGVRLRRLWLNVHLWIGAGLFVALCPLGLSGSLLVWNQAFDRMTSPGHYAVSGPANLPPSAYLAAGKAALGERANAGQVRLPARAGDPVVVSGPVAGKPKAGQRPAQLSAWLDPATGRVLDVGNARETANGVTHNLHGNLMIPGIGRKVVGWLGWAMTVSCLTGLWLWWPRRGLSALRWRRTSSTLNNLHHMAGIWVFAPLLILCLTGVYIAFPETSRAVFGLAQAGGAPGGGPGGGGRPPAATRLGIDQAAQAALGAAPGGRVVTISLPGGGKKPSWRVQVTPQGEDKPVTVTVADATGAATRAPAQAGGDPLSRLIRTAHDSHDAPLAWQIVVFFTGLAPSLLGISGIIVWLKRPKRSKAKRPGETVAAPANAG